MRARNLLAGCAVAMLGCGTVVQAPVDYDASIDASAPDAQTIGQVTVTITEGDAPIPGTFVLYHDPSGAQVGSARTDADGKLTITDMPLGGAVTWVDDNSLFYKISLETLADVQDGDDLHFSRGVVTAILYLDSGKDISVTLPAANGASTYDVWFRCRYGTATGNPSQTLAVNVANTCAPGDVIDVVAYGINGGRVNATSKANVTLADAAVMATFTMPASGGLGQVDAILPALDGAQATTRIYPTKSGQFIEGSTSFVGETLTTTTTTRSEKFATNFYNLVQSRAEITTPSVAGASLELERADDGALSSDLTADLTAVMPFIDALTVESSTVPIQLTYSASGPMECGDVGPAVMRQATLSAKNMGGESYSWNVYSPAASGPVVFPALSAVEESVFWPDALTPSYVSLRFTSQNLVDYGVYRQSDSARISPLTSSVGERACRTSLSKSLP